MTIGRVTAVSSGFTGAPGYHVFHFGVAVPPFNDAAADLASQRVIDAYTDAAALWPASWSITISADVLEIDEESGELVGAFDGNTATVVGTDSGLSFSPSPVGLLTTWTTGEFVNSHRVKGRTFHVPVSGHWGSDANGTPTATQVTLANTFGTSMRDAGATDCVFGIWSRPVDADHATPGSPVRDGSFHGVTGHSVKDKYVTLRSRRD
jgi:hypothetical protein